MCDDVVDVCSVALIDEPRVRGCARRRLGTRQFPALLTVL